MGLNGWQRIGIVLSVVWAIGGGLWGNSLALDDAQKRTSLQLDNCVSRNRARLNLKENEYGPYEQVWTPCWVEFKTNFMKNAEGHWLFAAMVGLIPIPIAWLVVYGFVALGRWIKAGFKSA